MDLFDKLERLSSISSTNEQISFLSSHKDDIALRDFLKLMIDDRIRFNVNKLPDYELVPGDFTFNSFIELCNKLHSKTLTGNAALNEIENVLKHSTEIQNKWYRLCLQKDASRLSVGRKIVNKVWPNLVLDFKVQLAESIDEIDKFVSYPAIAQLKLNGIRTILIIRNGLLENVYGRSGLPIENFSIFGKVLEEICKNDMFPQNFVLDGEVHVNNSLEDTMTIFGFDFGKTKEDFISKSGKLSKGWEQYCSRKNDANDLLNKSVFTVFDYLDIDEWDSQICKTIYKNRFDKVVNFFNDMVALDLECYFNIPETVIVDNIEEASCFAQTQINNGLEGAILKDPNSLYSFKRNRDWIKIKEMIPEIDLVIVGFEKQKEKYNSDGSIKPDMIGKVLAHDSGGNVHKIGTGKVLSEAMREDMYSNPDKYIGKVTCSAQRSSEDNKLICPRVDKINFELDIIRSDRESLET